MADWTTIPDSSIEPGKPIRSIDGLALRDNPIAISEGAAGAPRLVGSAAKRLQDYPVLTVTAADTYSVSNGIKPESLLSSTNSTSYVVAYRYTIQPYTGSIRLKCTHSSASTGLCYLALYKNNVLIQEYTIDTPTSTTRTNDVAVAPNDVFEWRIRTASSGFSTLFSAATATASDAYILRDLYIAQSEENNP